jgi:hypothetical protein
MCAQTKPKQRPNAGGRPTKYRPERGAEIYKLMAKGYTLMGAAGAIGLMRQTIYNWKKRYTEFASAIELGKGAFSAFWEERLLEGQTGMQIRTAMWMLKHVVPEEFSPKVARQMEKAANDSLMKQLYARIQGTAIRPRDDCDAWKRAPAPASTEKVAEVPETSPAKPKERVQGYVFSPETIAEHHRREARYRNQRTRWVSAAAI